VELEDRITVTAPEGVDVHIVLAGVASRFIAGMVDLFVQLVLIGLIALATVALIGGGIGLALFAMGAFAAIFLYDILFESFAAGRTPGKRWTHLRVLRAEGQPVDLPASAIRTVMRLIDYLPSFYLVGMSSIVLTKRNQRLGDLAAGTIVVREPGRKRSSVGNDSKREPLASPGWDVSAVSSDEIAAVRRFLERRDELGSEARRELGFRLEQGLREKVAGAPEGLTSECFLEMLVHVKSSRR
jgi:uncharacterized RDD family membrane protein YckC